MKVIVTGGSGLVGSHCCEFYARQGHEIISIENHTRGRIFGKVGETRENTEYLKQKYKNISIHEMDIRDEQIKPLLRGADLIIHTAAQTSHPKSIEIPREDFSINAYGTLHLLELTREVADKAVFVFCSTNKVYGENPNSLPLVEKGTRYDYADRDGISEDLPVDKTLHTPFGASKLAADIYCQEYGRLYGLDTGIFRLSCITGPLSKAVEMQNWEPYFIRVNLLGQTLNVYGFKGKQVRDVIDARDLVRAFDAFFKKPRKGEVYNMGGGRPNSISLLESFKLIERLTGKPMHYQLAPRRDGDHQVYITDLNKFTSHYPWKIEIGLEQVFRDIYEWLQRNPQLLK